MVGTARADIERQRAWTRHTRADTGTTRCPREKKGVDGSRLGRTIYNVYVRKGGSGWRKCRTRIKIERIRTRDPLKKPRTTKSASTKVFTTKRTKIFPAPVISRRRHCGTQSAVRVTIYEVAGTSRERDKLNVPPRDRKLVSRVPWNGAGLGCDRVRDSCLRRL